MLQVTARAATLLKEERSRQGIPDDFGLRVGRPTSDARDALELRFTPEPRRDDEVGETNGLRVFVAAEVAEPLAEQAIDTQSSESGSDLVLRDQRDVED